MPAYVGGPVAGKKPSSSGGFFGGITHALENVGHSVEHTTSSVARHVTRPSPRSSSRTSGSKEPFFHFTKGMFEPAFLARATSPLGPIVSQFADVKSLTPYFLSHPDSGDGGFLGAIEGAPLVGGVIKGLGSAGDFTANLAKNTGKDLLHLPSDTLKGLETLGSAAVNDLLHGRGGQPGGLNSLPGHEPQLTQLAHDAWHQSVIGHILAGDLAGALKTFEKDPLYGASEFTGAYGLLGRTAGAAARSGALGEHLAQVANTERAARELAPGLSQDVSHYSKNLATKGAQVAIEKHPALQEALYKATGRSAAAMLKRRIDEHVATSSAREQAMVQHAAEMLNAGKPKGAAANVAPFAVQGIAGGKEHFLEGLNQELVNLKAAESAHHSALANGIDEGRLSPGALEANLGHQENIAKFLEHPNVPAAFDTGYAARRSILDEAKAELGLIDRGQATRRTYMPYVEKQIESAIHAPAGSIPTERALLAIAARKDIALAEAAAREAELNHVKLTNMHGEAEAKVADAEKALSKAAKQEARTRGFVTGRYGLGRVQHHEGLEPGVNEPRLGLPKAQGERLNLHASRSAGSRSELQDMLAAKRVELAERRQEGKAGIAATKENLKAAKQEFAAQHKDHIKERYGGLVIPDSNAPLIRTGRYRGLRLRPLTNQEIEAHMIGHGVNPADVGYVDLRTPAESNRIIPSIMRRSGSKSARFTGKSLEAGSWTPGYGALAKTELTSTRQVARAMSHDEFIKDSAVKDANGQILTYNKVTGPHAAARYEEQSGIKVQLVPRHPQIDELKAATARAKQNGTSVESELLKKLGPRDNLVLIPDVMVKQYLKHQDVLNSGNSVIATANRAFRNTVLPMSPKWLFGNVAEAGLRGALVGASPRSFLLADRTIKRMRKLGLNDQADHLERMATGGLHYGMQHRLTMEQIGVRTPKDRSFVVNAAQKLSHSYTNLAQRIFAVNRKFESSAEKAVLGVHMQRQLQEFSGTWIKSVMLQKRYVDELARGYADQRMAADAGRYIHETLGQYDRFGPNMKRFVRKYAPFAPWYINALKFVYHTLPVKHPVAQAVLLDANRPGAAQWDKEHQVPHDNFFHSPVGDLLSSLKVGPNAYLNLGRYTPMGAFTSGPIDYGANMLLPQLSGPARAALAGQDPFGNTLEMPKGKVTDTGQRAAVALSDLLAEFAGPTEMLSRVIRQHGDTPYSGSTLWNLKLKKGTHHGPPGVLGGVMRVLNPLEPVYLGKYKTKGSSTKGPWNNF